jgi:hypothetical protein
LVNSTEANARASVWLNALSKSNLDNMPVYPQDFKTLSQLCGVKPVRILKNAEGVPRVFIIDREDTIQKIKDIYGFFTKKEAESQLKDAADI